MRLWAYCTSPHGLGLSTRTFWHLTHREYYALRDIQQGAARRWAISQSIMVNIHLKEGVEPYVPEDFLGTGNREKRAAERQRSDMLVTRENNRLQLIKPMMAGDEEPEDLPEWARLTAEEKSRLPRPTPAQKRLRQQQAATAADAAKRRGFLDLGGEGGKKRA